jgi:L-threonylcarbamoyladenylate synthase
MNDKIHTRLVDAEFVAIADAAVCLADGGLVAFPTETVYGLGADATNGAAVARLYAAKGRPSFNPLIAHVSDLRAAEKIARFDALARALAEAFWPGPLTLVLPKAPGCTVADLATAGLDTIALRVPAHPLARNLEPAGPACRGALANRSGRVADHRAHVMDDLGGRIDSSSMAGRIGRRQIHHRRLSRPPGAARPGGLPREQIEAVLGGPLDDPPVGAFDPEAPIAPGMLESHYAPRAQLRLAVDRVNPGEALLAFGIQLPAGTQDTAIVLNLSPNGDLVEAATNLFSDLRTLDQADVATIAVMTVPDEGLGEAINDRLARAAAPRSK